MRTNVRFIEPFTWLAWKHEYIGALFKNGNVEDLHNFGCIFTMSTMQNSPCENLSPLLWKQQGKKKKRHWQQGESNLQSLYSNDFTSNTFVITFSLRYHSMILSNPFRTNEESAMGPFRCMGLYDFGDE